MRFLAWSSKNMSGLMTSRAGVLSIPASMVISSMWIPWVPRVLRVRSTVSAPRAVTTYVRMVGVILRSLRISCCSSLVMLLNVLHVPFWIDSMVCWMLLIPLSSPASGPASIGSLAWLISYWV